MRIDIVFDGPPGHDAGRFVEVENEKGESIVAGEWINRGDGMWALRIDTSKYDFESAVHAERSIREYARKLATEAAKQNPPSYYTDDFEPHAWVVDAVTMGYQSGEKHIRVDKPAIIFTGYAGGTPTGRLKLGGSKPDEPPDIKLEVKEILHQAAASIAKLVEEYQPKIEAELKKLEPAREPPVIGADLRYRVEDVIDGAEDYAKKHTKNSGTELQPHGTPWVRALVAAILERTVPRSRPRQSVDGAIQRLKLRCAVKRIPFPLDDEARARMLLETVEEMIG